MSDILKFVDAYIAVYEDAPNWGGPTMYPAPLTIEQVKALRALASEGWQDISTAPTDGTVVWAYGTIKGDYGYTVDHDDMVKARYLDGKWRFAQPMGRHDPLSWEPTHWRPQPKAPTP